MNSSRAILINNPVFIALCFLLVVFAGIGALSVQYISPTYDESTHYAYGEQILRGNSQRTGLHGDSNMPFSAWNALPERLGSYLSAGPIQSFLMDFRTARYMTLIFSMMIALLVFHWSKSLYGTIPAFVSLSLYIFDPNIIAHSQLVTTDIYAAGMTALVFYCLWAFAHSRTLKNGLIFAFALGLSQLAKYTTIVLIPMSLLVLFLHDLPTLWDSWPAADKIKTFVLRYIGYIVFAAITLLVIINLGFLFNRTFTEFGKYKFRSDWFQAVRTKYPALKAIPVPVPYPYLDGIDWMRHTQTSGGNSGNVYLLGNTNKQGFPGYYFIASLVKVPIPTQIVIIAAVIVYFTQQERRRNFFQDEIFLFASVVFYSIYFNFLFNVQIGIRYYLIMFPLLYVFAGSLFKGWKEFRLAQKIAGFALFAYLVISVLSYYPYYLTYFNEIVWNRKDAYKYLADSNLDWGQSANQLRQYLRDHPDAIFEPADVQAGQLVVRVNNLVGVTDDPARFAWLRNNFEPVGTIANSILIFQISPGELENLGLTN
jgi:4-amino-4-deoxy-L-arabinose transferase-like glycosyltransferase